MKSMFGIVILTLLISISNIQALQMNQFPPDLPDNVEIIDGVEYVNIPDSNDTLMLKMS